MSRYPEGGLVTVKFLGSMMGLFNIRISLFIDGIDDFVERHYNEDKSNI